MATVNLLIILPLWRVLKGEKKKSLSIVYDTDDTEVPDGLLGINVLSCKLFQSFALAGMDSCLYIM